METAISVKDTVERVKRVLISENVQKIILFGSAVNGELGEDSDLDLLIVMDTDFAPSSYDERLEYRANIQKSVREIAMVVPMDLLIYTRREYKQLSENMNSFMKDVHEAGRVIYEKAR
jgi:uncharacterized protein